MTDPDWIEVAKICGALIAFGFGLRQYRNAQAWKRAEFIAEEVRRFDETLLVKNAKLMLDWTKRKVDLFPERENAETRSTTVTDEMVRHALRPHDENTEFTLEEARIRDAFDSFLGGLERFEHFISLDLITAKECKPYLEYWIALAKGGTRRPELGPALTAYIKFYKFDGVKSLFKRYEF